jgi:hypothetical protein
MVGVGDDRCRAAVGGETSRLERCDPKLSWNFLGRGSAAAPDGNMQTRDQAEGALDDRDEDAGVMDDRDEEADDEPDHDQQQDAFGVKHCFPPLGRYVRPGRPNFGWCGRHLAVCSQKSQELFYDFMP